MSTSCCLTTVGLCPAPVPSATDQALPSHTMAPGPWPHPNTPPPAYTEFIGPPPFRPSRSYMATLPYVPPLYCFGRSLTSPPPFVTDKWIINNPLPRFPVRCIGSKSLQSDLSTSLLLVFICVPSYMYVYICELLPSYIYTLYHRIHHTFVPFYFWALYKSLAFTCTCM